MAKEKRIKTESIRIRVTKEKKELIKEYCEQNDTTITALLNKFFDVLVKK